MAAPTNDAMEAYIQSLLCEDNETEKPPADGLDPVRPDKTLSPRADSSPVQKESSEPNEVIKVQNSLPITDEKPPCGEQNRVLHSLPDEPVREVERSFEAPLQPLLREQEQEEVKAQSVVERDLHILEEAKRQQLQQMLSQQTMLELKTEPKTETQTQVKTEVNTKTVVDVEPAALNVQAPAKVKTEQTIQTKDPTRIAVQAQEESQVDIVLREGVLNLLEWQDNGRPVWAQNDFDALFFQVAGLTLAVPLVALGQIVSVTKKPTPIAGQSDWFMGMMSTSLGEIRTVNTALFVMPERYNPAFLDSVKFLISIDGLPWGLAVDNVNQPVRLHPDDVKWRKVRGKRPWLAGTVKSKMCALIDIPQMANLLNQSDKNMR